MLTLLDFLGDWRLSRRIDDALAGRAGTFEGTARLTPEGDGLRYREEGRLRLGDGPAMTATREYQWAREDGADDGAIAVRFADGRPFHAFAPRDVTVAAVHDCGADRYRVAYDFAAWPAWSATWRVDGPAKRYRMRSDYARP